MGIFAKILIKCGSILLPKHKVVIKSIFSLKYGDFFMLTTRRVCLVLHLSIHLGKRGRLPLARVPTRIGKLFFYQVAPLLA
jgi:hypothetical protein